MLAILLSVPATIFYATNASSLDVGTGSLSDPFTSIQSCVAALSAPGDECLLLGGMYRLNQTVVVQNLHGTLAAPYRISAAPGADVLFDGTLDARHSERIAGTVHVEICAAL